MEDNGFPCLDLCRNADPEDEFDHFEEQRETNVECLRSLPAEMAGRVATHREAGEITLAHMLHEWALHDLGHVRQVAELVRARKYPGRSRTARTVLPTQAMTLRPAMRKTRVLVLEEFTVFTRLVGDAEHGRRNSGAALSQFEV